MVGSTGRVTSRMMFDTGGGVTLVSKRLCDRVGCVPDGSFTGTRMSGQALTLTMARVPSIVVAGHHATNVRVAVMEGEEFVDPKLGIEGSLGLDAFRDRAFTLDYGASRLVIEDDASLAKRHAAGEVVDIRVENDQTSTVIYLPLELLPGQPPLEMEVDTGSLVMILDDRFMAPLAIDPKQSGIERQVGRDQSNHPYVRTYASLPKAAPIASSKDIKVPAGAPMMFQKIIHDGLIGHQFLSAYTTTFDVPHGKMVFARMR